MSHRSKVVPVQIRVRHNVNKLDIEGTIWYSVITGQSTKVYEIPFISEEDLRRQILVLFGIPLGSLKWKEKIYKVRLEMF